MAVKRWKRWGKEEEGEEEERRRKKEVNGDWKDKVKKEIRRREKEGTREENGKKWW